MHTILSEFGPDFARELSEDMPSVDPRMVAMPWHNDTCPKYEATLANGYIVQLWAERRDPNAREYVGESRFVVQVYATEDDVMAGTTAVPEVGTDCAADVAELVAVALKIAELAIRIERDEYGAYRVVERGVPAHRWPTRALAARRAIAMARWAIRNGGDI